MKIAFDLDDTLIPSTTEFSGGSSQLRFPLNLIFKEKLRNGADSLLKQLSQQHDILIYTTSLRTNFYIKLWFYAWGVPIKSVINHNSHQIQTQNTAYAKYSKAPKLFDIDILIDDLPGVATECEQQECKAIIIKPDESNWVKKIEIAINAQCQ